MNAPPRIGLGRHLIDVARNDLILMVFLLMVVRLFFGVSRVIGRGGMIMLQYWHL